MNRKVYQVHKVIKFKVRWYIFLNIHAKWYNESMKQKIKLLLVAFLFGVIPNFSHAAPVPVLNFSDIESGPKTGNTDGVGSGAIITIWGNYLGATQGASKIYVGNVEATAIYYWKNADGQLPGGPADLYTYHKMQEISFAIPAGAPDGASTIKVVVNGTETNTLPFTVRSGNIYFVKSGGDDSTGNGSWSNPWATLQSVFDGGNGKISAGDIVYTAGVGSVAGINVGVNQRILGTINNPISLIAYPNTLVHVTGESYTGYVIQNFNNQEDNLANEYINYAKLKITAAGDKDDFSSGVRASKGNRLVALEITGPTVYGGYGGAITGNRVAAGGGKYYGIYIHDYGTDNGVSYAGHTGTDPKNCAYTDPACKSSWDVYQHLYYLSNRSSTTIDAYEIAWNNLVDNPIWQGIHIYDETSTGGWNGTMKVHHNVVRNQRGGAIEVGLTDPLTVIPPIEIHDNIVISDDLDTYNYRAFQLRANNCSMKVYNNTVYGYNSSNVFQFGATDYRNNLMVDSKGIDFIYDNLSTLPNTQSDNLFYSLFGRPKPSWASVATGNINANPIFVDAASYDFSLQESSPAIDAGYDTTQIAPRDFFGQPRTAGQVDIGAIEYIPASDTLPPSAPAGLAVE